MERTFNEILTEQIEALIARTDEFKVFAFRAILTSEAEGTEDGREYAALVQAALALGLQQSAILILIAQAVRDERARAGIDVYACSECGVRPTEPGAPCACAPYPRESVRGRSRSKRSAVPDR